MAKNRVSGDHFYRYAWVAILLWVLTQPSAASAGESGWHSPAANPPATAVQPAQPSDSAGKPAQPLDRAGQLSKPLDSAGQTTVRPMGLAGAPATEWTFHKTSDNVHPDGREQQVLWLMNRARANPAAEGEWLAASNDFEITGPRNYFGVDLDMLRGEFEAYAARPPAAFDVRLYNAARAHSEEMIRRDAQDHTGQFERITAAGFVCAGGRGNVYSYASSAINAHAAWNIDWGVGPGGMQVDRGHRQALIPLEGDYTNAGIALVFENNARTQVGPYVSTGNYCIAGNAANHYNRFLVGTVWQDRDGDAIYDPGEGIGGVTVTPERGEFYAVTAPSGGYALPLTATGAMEVIFSGRESGTRSVTVAAESILLDFVTAPATGDQLLYLPLTVR